jgi:large subunit ribosomal protein L17
MHRHGYKGRKFHRERDQREALVKSLAESLIIYEKIETTLPKAKEVVPYVEKLITKAKKGDLHNRRQIMSKLHMVSTTHKLVDEIAPKLGGRNSGHLRVERTKLRRGDNAQMAEVSFVDDLKASPVSVAAPKQAEPKKSVAKKASAAKKTTAKKTEEKA